MIRNETECQEASKSPGIRPTVSLSAPILRFSPRRITKNCIAVRTLIGAPAAQILGVGYDRLVI
jgi:hypothetical protein